MRRLTTGLCALVLALAFSGVTSAQQTSGTILGRVLDAQGAAIPGASITARNPETGFTRTVVSDEAGVYRLSALSVGQYQITVELSGFNTLERKVSSSASARR